ncbi:acyl-CoA dehydrogenase [Nocardioides massiliensis]|uniref:Alkylation response protein AidB-like acyl-CoA dehydrogenase n=1 Tax=Nocardioides massiliensis TaxID=1325935 RepID=A0ABT9NS02_9ACTN|nr:acyl-CoA dehydrogenase [Nocardioides massiliensis]MDP9823173.1 alkylation response protein AidB-like acyl-CoA dehydrogenase [Nocardioides massiliensis]
MRFEPTSEQRDFVASLDRLLASSDTVAANRAWSEGDAGAGTTLWQRLAEQGVHALVVAEDAGGMGASDVELVLAHELLGRYAVPGPWAEVAYLSHALADDEALAALAEGELATVAAPPHTPYAVDGASAAVVYVAQEGTLHRASVAAAAESVDRSRKLATVTAGDAVPTGDLERAFDTAVLATAAHLLGAGERVLADTVDYVKQRRQFGREIGSYQAIKHQLADVRIALDFARPLIRGAALAEPGDRARDVSAAKSAAADAAYLASRVGLQCHGAIGYTQEFDLSLWITRIRALVSAWGTPAFHRRRVLAAVLPAATR